MSVTTKTVKPKAAKPKATKRVKPREENVQSWEAFVCDASHNIHYLADGKTSHSISMLLEDRDSGWQLPKEFPLGTAFEVAEMRRIFAVIDFPLVSAEDLDIACERIMHAECWVEVQLVPDGINLDPEDAWPELWEVLSVEFAKIKNDGPEAQNKEDIWNHRLHWEMRKKQREEREAREEL
jgi:hypothetical protein